MAKQQTALQELIKYLEKKHDQCQPFSPSIPFLQMAIGEAKDLLKKEREQIESAYEKGCDDSGYPKPLPQTGWIYYNDTFQK